MIPFINSLKIKEVYDLAERLNQNKYNNRKITDIAISKVPYVSYPKLSANDSLILHELAEYCLKLSKEQNNSNEVALTYNLDSKMLIENGFDNIIKETGICFGTKTETNLYSDTKTMLMLWQAKNTTIINVHNHPSCGPFSMQDIDFFLSHSTVKLMIVVGNNGELFYMDKDSCKYNNRIAINIFHDSLNQIHPLSDINYTWKTEDLRKASELFFKSAVICGINYQHALGNDIKLKRQKERDDDYAR